MKSKFLWLWMIVFAVLLIGCNSAEKKGSSIQNNVTNLPMSNSKKEVLKKGIYGLQTENLEMVPTYLEIKEDGEYLFNRDDVFSFRQKGRYEVIENHLVLQYVSYPKQRIEFVIENGNLVFQSEEGKAPKILIFEYKGTAQELGIDTNDWDSVPKQAIHMGIYELQTENQEKESAFIEIKANGKFKFSRSLEMSSVSRGEYKLKGDVLLLHDEVSKSVDKFKIHNDKLIYLNEGSIPERYSIFKYRDEKKSSDSNSKDSPAGTVPNEKGEQKIEFGRYVCGSLDEPATFAGISFSRDNRFVYELNVLSSFLPRGEFLVDGENLFLFLDNGEVYTFTIAGEKLISQDENQWVKKGSVFTLQK